MKKTRLETLCTIFGWSGGTIHLVQREAEDCLETDLDILGMPESDFRNVCIELARQYPAYSAYQLEMERERDQ